MTDVRAALRAHDINPSAQRVAIAGYVLGVTSHPSADEVWTEVKARLPSVSRATVYNTLNLFVERGLLRQLVIRGGSVVFDPNLEPHHHFVDDETGEIHDLPWDAVAVQAADDLEGYDVREMQVVLRGTRRA